MVVIVPVVPVEVPVVAPVVVLDVVVEVVVEVVVVVSVHSTAVSLVSSTHSSSPHPAVMIAHSARLIAVLLIPNILFVSFLLKRHLSTRAFPAVKWWGTCKPVPPCGNETFTRSLDR